MTVIDMDGAKALLRRAGELCRSAEPHGNYICGRHMDEARRQLAGSSGGGGQPTAAWGSVAPTVARAATSSRGPVSAWPALRSCRVCGCTDEDGCWPGCVWVEPDLCSACELVAFIAQLEAL